MREGGEDDDKGMVSNIDSSWSLGGKEMSRSIRDWICVCMALVVVMAVVLVVVALMVVMGVVVLMVVVGIVLLVMVVRVSCIGGLGMVGVLCIGVLEMDSAGVDILVLGGVFVVEVVEGVKLVVRCVVRHVVKLVLWCVNEMGYFLCCFSLKSVEMNGLSVGGFLFGMVIWADCLILLEQGFLGKMVGADVLMDVVVEVVVVETVDVVQVWFFVFFWHGCLGDMVGVRVVIEVVVGVVDVVCSVRMGVGVGRVGNRGGGVVSGGGNVSATDGGGAKWRDCCRFPDEILGEIRENLPYRLPFTLNIGNVFS